MEAVHLFLSPLTDHYCMHCISFGFAIWLIRQSKQFISYVKSALHRLPVRTSKRVKFLLFIAVSDPLFPREVNLAHGLASLLLGA